MRPIAIALALGTLLLLASFAAGSEEASATEAETGRRAQAAALDAELDAAKSHAIYLALDPRAGHLDLKVDGLLLRRFPVAKGLLGRARFGGAGAGFPASSFTLVTELPEPERPLIPIRSPNEGAGAGSSSLAVSEARTEAVGKMPSHYRLLFDPPLELSIRGEAGTEASAIDSIWRLRFRLFEGWQAIGHRLRGRTVPARVVLFLDPTDARRLFMTLDPHIRLIVSAGP